MIAAKRELFVLARFGGSRDEVDPEHLLRNRSLREKVVRHRRDCARVADPVSSQWDQ